MINFKPDYIKIAFVITKAIKLYKNWTYINIFILHNILFINLLKILKPIFKIN